MELGNISIAHMWLSRKQWQMWWKLTINNKWESMHGLSTSIFTFDLGQSKDQGQDHAHFDNEYLGNGDR